MGIYTALLSLCSFVGALCAGYILAQSPRQRATQLAALLAATASWWALCEARWNAAHDAIEALHWMRLSAPGWVFLAFAIENIFRNNWMHMNVTWRSNWLEWVLVTPRYHHIHHSADAKLHDGNYGALFSIWDRLFGTYLDPDTTAPRKFGTGEPRRDPVLLVLGA